MAEKSLHLQTLERLQSALDNFDTSFIVSNKLFRLALVSEILDTACMFEQLLNAWSEKLPYGEEADADIDFEHWKNYRTWEELVDNAQQAVCLDDTTIELGNGMTTDEVKTKRKKNYNKILTAALKQAHYPASKSIVDFLKLLESDKEGMITYSNMVYGALQSLCSVLNKINTLQKNPPAELLSSYCLQQKERFAEDIKQGLGHIKEIASSSIPQKRRQYQLMAFEDQLKDNLFKSGFLSGFADEITGYEVSDYRDLTKDYESSEETIRNTIALNDLSNEYFDGTFGKLNIYLFNNRKELSPLAIQSFFVYVETYGELQLRISELKGLQQNKGQQDNKVLVELSSQDQALQKRILGYVSHGDWQMPATFDNVRAWLSTLFGGDTTGLDDEDVEKTRAFRDFFKGGRAGEDTDRVEVSMANILGYLMSYQLLAGGQKQISTEFFGNDGQVNNINKGKNGEGSQAFKNLIPLMDKYRVRVIGE